MYNNWTVCHMRAPPNPCMPMTDQEPHLLPVTLKCNMHIYEYAYCSLMHHEIKSTLE